MNTSGQQAIEQMITLTEAKIAAVLARDPQQLLTLLQAELDPLHCLDRFDDSINTLSAEERATIRQRLEHWQRRTEFFVHLLHQHLGYIDFVRSVLNGPQPPSGLDIGI